MEAYQRLQHWWAETPGRITFEVTPLKTVQALEERYRIKLPSDFRNYLLNSCPTNEEQADVNNTFWWNIHRISNITDEYKHVIRHPDIAMIANQYLFFADFAIWCWAWAIACTDDQNRGKVAIIGGDLNNPDQFVAGSFSEFITTYIEDFDSVCRFGSG